MFSHTRRALLLGMGGFLMTNASRVAAASSDWAPITPAEAGFAPDLAGRLDDGVLGERLAGLHGIVILRDGRLVVERYYAGEDASWGRPLGRVAFAPDTLHDMRSVGKSVVGLLYGIALAEQKVPAPDQPLLAQFPEYPELAAGPQRRRLTIGHVLTMTLGMEWNEDLPYTNAANSEIAMERAADRYRFILERPFVAEPGERWIYCGGATALLGRIIAMGTGRRLLAFARERLFEPLGIGASEWVNGTNGDEAVASGLRMKPRDLARIGQMILNGGRWDGRQVVPAAWLEQTFRPAATCDEFRRYGYHWYVGEFPLGAGGARATSGG